MKDKTSHHQAEHCFYMGLLITIVKEVSNPAAALQPMTA